MNTVTIQFIQENVKNVVKKYIQHGMLWDNIMKTDGRGNFLLLDPKYKKVGIIGHRNSNLTERSYAYSVADAMMNDGCVIVSGLARGVDTFAHVGGRYRTIAVLPNLGGKIYPPENQAMAEQIVEKGGLLIHPSYRSTVDKLAFLQRNELLVEICDIIYAIGKIEGGLGYTVKFAQKMKKEVFLC